MYREHEDYRWEVEQTLRAVSAGPDASAYAVPLDVNGLLAHAEREGKDPASRQTRLDCNDWLDPRCESPGTSADGERLVSIATEAGQQFCYRYDFGDEWWHTVTLEQARPAGPENTFQILDGAGACPPEDCGGSGGYGSAGSADAVDRLGEDHDPGRYQPHRELRSTPR
jgi:hypothetical protein